MFALLVGCGVGLGLVVNPLLGIGAIAVGGIAVLLTVDVRARSGIFLSALGLLLVGYAFMGRGFAYLGHSPVYVGELVLGLGLLLLGVRGGIGRRPWWFLAPTLAFMAWGVVGVIAGLPKYGVDALRDGVIWGYATFALLCATAILRTRGTGAAIRTYAKLIPLFVCWIPLALFLPHLSPSWLPFAPGTEIPIISVGNDAAVHLAGIGAFWLLGVGKEDLEAGHAGRLKGWVLWVPWAAGFFLRTTNRASVLTVIMPLALVMLLGQRVRWMKGAVVLACVTAGLLVADVHIIPRGEQISGREISPRQVILGLKSVVGSSEREELESTREWRLNWWSDIVRYTFGGEHFWWGKGFGVNLATDDGYQVMEDESLRSPHSGHMTVLARMGVPGMLLWVILQGMFAIKCFGAFVRARRKSQHRVANLDLWLLSYWLAFMINMTFGVALEGPQGGIWFWSLIGFAVAQLGMQAHGIGHDGVAQQGESPVIS